MSTPIKFLARDVTWGFVVKVRPEPCGGAWEIHVAPELNGEPVQFSRVLLGPDAHAGASDRTVLMLDRNTRADDEADLVVARRALEKQHAGALVLVGRSVGEARIEMDAGELIPPVGVAAAAVSVYNGTLDDLEAVEVRTSEAQYRVGVSFRDGIWCAVVEGVARLDAAPDGPEAARA